MSWLSKATGIHVNLKPLAPIIGGAVGSIIPGVGTALGAGLGSFLNGVGNGQSIGKSALSGLAAGAGGAALGKLGGLASKIPGASTAGGLLGGVKNAVGSIPGVSGIEKGVGGYLDQHGGIGGLLGGVVDKVTADPLGTLGGINSAIDAAHARDLQGKAEGLALDNYSQRAPLRAAGVAGLLKPAVPDLSGINYGSSGSVYGKKRQPAVAGGGY